MYCTAIIFASEHIRKVLDTIKVKIETNVIKSQPAPDQISKVSKIIFISLSTSNSVAQLHYTALVAGGLPQSFTAMLSSPLHTFGHCTCDSRTTNVLFWQVLWVVGRWVFDFLIWQSPLLQTTAWPGFLHWFLKVLFSSRTRQSLVYIQPSNFYLILKYLQIYWLKVLCEVQVVLWRDIYFIKRTQTKKLGWCSMLEK